MFGGVEKSYNVMRKWEMSIYFKITFYPLRKWLLRNSLFRVFYSGNQSDREVHSI